MISSISRWIKSWIPDTGSIEIKHTIFAPTSSQGFEEDRQEHRTEMQDYGPLYRAGVHIHAAARPCVQWGRRKPQKVGNAHVTGRWSPTACVNVDRGAPEGRTCHQGC